MFRFHLDRTLREPLVQQAREQIVSALHLGQLQTGDRLPSVRSLSRTWRIDPKTAFRIYHALAREGYVRLRPGSGAYVKEVSQSLLDQAHALGLLKLVRRHIADAGQFDVDALRYMEIVTRYARGRAGAGESSDRIAVIECNVEQVNLFSDELRRRLRVSTLPLLLPAALRLSAPALAEVRACRYLVTTDFHFAEVEPLAARLGRRLLCIRLDPDFIQSLVALASRGALGMIVTDVAFLPAFRRSIMALGLDPRAAKRIEAAAGSQPDRVRALIARSDSLYVSPPCEAAVDRLIPKTMAVLRPLVHLSEESVESIEALLLFGDGMDRAPSLGPRPTESVPDRSGAGVLAGRARPSPRPRR